VCSCSSLGDNDGKLVLGLVFGVIFGVIRSRLCLIGLVSFFPCVSFLPSIALSQ
jgi:hypothetical protein